MVGTNLGKCEWVWEEKLRCLDAPIYLDDVWMSPVHTQHKESMLCQTKGVSICPHRFRCHHMLGYHLYVGMPPLCLDAAMCLDAPPVCLNATLCLNTPICLDTPVCLDVPICLDTFICLDAHLYVWIYPICLHSPCLDAPVCLGAPYLWTLLCMVGHPQTFDTPCMFGCPPYVWLPPVCLDVGIQTYGSVQMY